MLDVTTLLVLVAVFQLAAAAGTGYAPAESCTACHAAVAETYHGVSMSQSAGRFPAASLIEDFQRPNTFVHAPSNRHYRMTERNGRYFQRRWQVDERGREMHVFERQITHFIGSGRHARSYLYLAPSGELTQLPITWYAQERRWGMSPGYDTPRHYDFSRTVDFGCVFCHAASPNLPEGADAFGRRPLWTTDLPDAIDCQRCHGPGSRHVQLAQTGALAMQVRSAIVNPRRLDRKLQMDVCLQCHLQTTSDPLPHALRRFGRGAFSYRPGQALSDYLVHFDYPPAAGRQDSFEINGHGHRLLQSACYLKSGRMTCTTCHNPHHSERGPTARANHNRQCASCHKPHMASHRPDCVSCHMPRRRTEDAIHVVMTDHKIQRGLSRMNPEATLSERHDPYRGPLKVAHTPGMSPADRRVYLAMARCQGQRASCADLAGSTPMEARLLAARATASTRLYRELLDAAPELASVRAEYGTLLARAGHRTEALAEFGKAATSPDAPPSAHLGIARLLIALKRPREAIEHFRQAASSATARAEALNNLGNLLASLDRMDDAQREIEAALTFEPDFAEAHNNLARIHAMQGRILDALASARRAVAIDPSYAEAHYNLGRLLHESGDREAAMQSYRRAIELNPKLAAAHFSLGVALAEANELDAARRSFDGTLRLDPSHAGARENLRRIEGANRR